MLRWYGFRYRLVRVGGGSPGSSWKPTLCDFSGVLAESTRRCSANPGAAEHKAANTEKHLVHAKNRHIYLRTRRRIGPGNARTGDQVCRNSRLNRLSPGRRARSVAGHLATRLWNQSQSRLEDQHTRFSPMTSHEVGSASMRRNRWSDRTSLSACQPCLDGPSVPQRKSFGPAGVRRIGI